MSIIFPLNPVVDQEFSVAGKNWRWDGSKWNLITIPFVFLDNFLVPSDLTDLEVDLIPKVDETIDLGSPTLKWKDLYLSGDSIYLGDIVLKETDAGLGIFGADGETAANIAIAPNSLTDAVLSDDTGQIKNKVTLVEGRLDVVQGASNIEGSIAKALKDAKDYTDIAELGFGNNYSVATIEERDALTNLFVGDLVFVADTGSEKWAQFKVTTTDPTVTFLKIMDQDVLTNAIDAPGIKSAYESNEDTNAFTDALLTKLNALDVVFFEGAEVPVLSGAGVNSVWNLVESGVYNGAYIANITVAGLLATDNPIVDLDLNDISVANWAAIENDWSLIKLVEITAADTITFYASEEPTEDLYFVVKVVR